jgi:hypothetical protein
MTSQTEAKAVLHDLTAEIGDRYRVTVVEHGVMYEVLEGLTYICLLTYFPDYRYHWAATWNTDAREQDIRRYRTASEAVYHYRNRD